MLTISARHFNALGSGSVATCPRRLNSSDLRTINGISFKTPDINGENTTFTFNTNKHEKTVQGLSYTSYFRYGENLGLKYHFTVILRITNTPPEGGRTPPVPVIHIKYCNPHLTVRTDENASQQANRPALHISCDNPEEEGWTGNDHQIDKSQLPPQSAATQMWESFKDSLKEFFIESTLEEDEQLADQ